MTLRETLERIRKMNAPTNEQTTIERIIKPVLGDLGWDISDARSRDEVKYEQPVGNGRSGGGRVDIALRDKHDQYVCFVEAKSPGTFLDRHVDQLLKYALHSGVPISVLTDGFVWQLYLLWESGSLEERQFSVLYLREDPIEQIETDLWTFLSRSTVQSGKAKSDAMEVLNRHKREGKIAKVLPDIWHKMLTEPDTELVDRVQSRVYAELRFSPSDNQIAEFLADTLPSLSNDKVRRETETKKRRKILEATVFGVPKKLRYWKDMWIFVVEEVQVRHRQDFLEKAAHLRGSNRVFVSGDYHPNMKRPAKVGDPEIVVEIDLTADDCVDLSRRLLERFGYSYSDLRIEED